MVEYRPFAELGHADHGWLDARHHFSFADYHDPARMGWGPIRVWNDDRIAAHSGFPMHPHRDMEIVTYVREGAISHRDSLGNDGRTAAGDVQVMSAGTGIVHSEMNAEDEDTRLFQIWVIPRMGGGQPRWDMKPFPKGDRANRLEILASGFAADIQAGALEIRADARLYAATLEAGHAVTHRPIADSHIYLVAARGRLSVNGGMIGEGDALAIRDENSLLIEAESDAEFLFVEAQG